MRAEKGNKMYQIIKRKKINSGTSALLIKEGSAFYDHDAVSRYAIIYKGNTGNCSNIYMNENGTIIDIDNLAKDFFDAHALNQYSDNDIKNCKNELDFDKLAQQLSENAYKTFRNL